MAILTLTQAAKAAGIARSTIYRAIRAGRLSLVSTPGGGRGVDTSELQRVFGPLQRAASEDVAGDPPQDVALLRVRCEMLERENQLLRDELAAYRAREGKLLNALPSGLLEGSKGKRRKGKKKGR